LEDGEWQTGRRMNGMGWKMGDVEDRRWKKDGSYSNVAGNDYFLFFLLFLEREGRGKNGIGWRMGDVESW
jgi:hypothetical protein